MKKSKNHNAILVAEDLKAFKSIDDHKAIAKPKKPYTPSKPWKPTKKIMQGRTIELTNKRTLENIIENIPKEIKFSDVKVVVHEEHEYYSENSYRTVYLEYSVEIDNPHYNSQVIMQDKALKNYESKMKKYEPLLKKYLKEKEVYDIYNAKKIKIFRSKWKEREIQELETRLNKLKNIK